MTDGRARLAADVLAAAQKMSAMGLSPNRSGNVSARSGNIIAITPTGLPYEGMSAADIVLLDPAGTPEPGQKRPSSEWRFHVDTYAARPDVRAIVHTHSLHATVLACAQLAIPAFHYMVAVAGGDDIPLVPYATFGSVELSQHVVSGLQHRDACLMANHGQIAVGGTLEAALELAIEVETLAEQYWKVRLLGREHVLDAAEMARVLAKFRSYGQRGPG